MNRKLLTLLMTLVLMLPLLAACGGDDATNTATGGGGTNATQAPTQGGQPQATQAPAQGGQTQAPGGTASGELTVWGMGAEGEKLRLLADDFTKENPNVKVKVVPVAWDVAHDKLLTSVGGRQTPDISQMGTTWMGEFAEIGALEEVPGSINQNAYFESARNTAVVDGKAYGVPWYVETRLLYYRTDIAKKAGITKAPETWDEVKALARAMKEKGGAKNGIALAPNNWQELLPFVWQNGGQVMNENGEFTLNDPKVIEAITYYQSFFKEGLASETVPQGFDVTQGFIAGTHPMFFSGPWHLSLVEEQGGEKLKGKWDVAMMPKKETRTSFVGGSDMVVFKDSKNKEAAWKFIEFISRPQVQSKWYQTVSALPSVQAAWESGELKTDKHLALFGEQLKDTKAPPVIPEWEEIGTAINSEMEKAMIGDATPEQAAQAMQDQATSIAR